MNPIKLVLLAASLSTDAFAASLARGSRERDSRLARAAGSGAIFGATEGLMCLAGWLLAHAFAAHIQALDHWIALILLGVIGIRMIREGLAHEERPADDTRRSSIAMTLATAVGTSIDSAAVGVALALTGVSAFAALVIGLFSFLASTIGFLAGPWVGRRLGGLAEIFGGLVLIALGISIFTAHTFAA